MPTLRPSRTRGASAPPPKDGFQRSIPRPLPIPKHGQLTQAGPPSPFPPAPSVPRAAQTTGFTLPDRPDLPPGKSPQNSPHGMFFTGQGHDRTIPTPEPQRAHARYSLPARPKRDSEGRGTIRAVPPELGIPIPSTVEARSIGPAFARREAARRVTPPPTPPTPHHPSTPAANSPPFARKSNDKRESHESSGSSGTERTDATEGSEVTKGVKALDDMPQDDDDERLRLFSASSWSLALRKRGGFKRVKNALRAFGVGRKRRPTISMPVLHDEIPRPSAAWDTSSVPPVPVVPDAYRREAQSPYPEGKGTGTMQLERITNERDKHPSAPPNGRGGRSSDSNGYPNGLENGDVIGRVNGHANGHAHKRDATFGHPSPRVSTADRAQTLYSKSDVGTGTRSGSGNYTVRRKPVPMLHRDGRDGSDDEDVILSDAPGAFHVHRPLMRARSVPHRPDGPPMGTIGTSLPPPPRKRR